MLCRKISNSCDRVALNLYSGMDILSFCFLCLIQDASALSICRVFVATATTLPGVNPLEYDVPPKSRCRISSAVLIQEIDRLSRPSPQKTYLTGHPVFTLLASLQRIRTENTGISGIDLQGVNLSFIPTKSNHPERFFLRGISPLKVSPP